MPCRGGCSTYKEQSDKVSRLQATAKAVVALSHKNADSHIHVNIEFGEGDGKISLDKIAEKAELI